METPSTTKAIADAAPSTGNGSRSGIRRLFSAARQLHEREKLRIRGEIAHIPGMMALLMKPRNGKKWTREERAQLRMQLRCLSHLGFYLTMLALPFTSLTLPLVAWWLDRRRQRRL